MVGSSRRLRSRSRTCGALEGIGNGGDENREENIPGHCAPEDAFD